MLPGGELQKIKDINEKIRKTIALINFTLSIEQKCDKKSTQKAKRSNSVEEEDKEEQEAPMVRSRT